MTPVSPLAKLGSAPFKGMWQAWKAVLDVHRAILVIEGVLDRQALQELVQKLTPGGAGRLQQVDRAQLVGRVTDAFLKNVDAAHAIAVQLDRLSHKERFIVASIPADAVMERIESYRAVDFRRERARMIWALVRDGRAQHIEAAERVLSAAFEQARAAEVLDEKTAQAAAHGGSELAPAAVLLELKDRLATYTQTIQKQQQALADDSQTRDNIERERSEMMVRLGQRERALRDEERLRRASEQERARVDGELVELRSELAQLRALQAPEIAAEREQFKQRAAQLEAKLARHAAHDTTEIEAQLQRLTRAQIDTERAYHKQVQALQQQLDDVTAELAREQERKATLREELHAARQSKNDAQADGEHTLVRVGVFVDAANLSASARREFGSKLDYRALLSVVLDGRHKATAIAYVVKDGDASLYQGFAANLRDGGYELREKTPRRRADGSKKADWDMGIAMEILDTLKDVDVVALCSGDGDYLPLVKRIKREGKRVEVFAFRSSTEEGLMRAADAYVPLDGRFRMMS